MKKLILILTLIFALTLCFVACDVADENSDGSQTEDSTETSVNNDIEQATMEPVSVEEKRIELIAALISYLRGIMTDYDLPDIVPFHEQVKRGKQPLYLKFSPDSYYYMCGYYNPIHEYVENMYSSCCVQEYTWVEFENATDILDEYNGQKFVVAFQINKTSLVKDVSANAEAVPKVEYFQVFTPEFENGSNVNESIIFDKTFLYANSSKKSIVFCHDPLYEDGATVFCEKRQGEYYIVDKYYDLLSLNEFVKRYILY